MLPGEKYKTARWANTAVKLNCAYWAFFFIGIMLQVLKQSLMSLMLQILSLNNRRSLSPRGKKSTEGLFCCNGYWNSFWYARFTVVSFCCLCIRPKRICWYTVSFSQELHTQMCPWKHTLTEAHYKNTHTHSINKPDIFSHTEAWLKLIWPF